MPAVNALVLILLVSLGLGAGPADQPVARLGVLADVHIGDGPDAAKVYSMSEELLTEAVRRINERGDYDAVLVPGDLTENGGEDDHRRAVEILNGLDVPWYVVPGNHETVSKRRFERAAMDELWAEHSPGPGLYFHVELKPGVHLFGLDSTKDFRHGGVISADQLELVTSTMAGREDELAVAMLHHNVLHPMTDQEQDLSGYGANIQLENYEVVEDTLADAGVDLTVAGHSNLVSVQRGEGGVWHFVSPAPSTWPCAFSTIELFEDGWHLKIEKLSEDAALKSMHGIRREHGALRATAFAVKAQGDLALWNKWFNWEEE